MKLATEIANGELAILNLLHNLITKIFGFTQASEVIQLFRNHSRFPNFFQFIDYSLSYFRRFAQFIQIEQKLIPLKVSSAVLSTVNAKPLFNLSNLLENGTYQKHYPAWGGVVILQRLNWTNM